MGKARGSQLLLAADIPQTLELLDGLRIERGFPARAEKSPDLLLRVHPLADLRHHALNYLRILARNVLGLAAVGTAIVQLDLVHPYFLSLVTVDELPACIEQRHRV